MDVRKVVSAPVHRDLLLPVVEGPRDVHLPPPVLPSKYRGHQLFVFDRFSERDGDRGGGGGGGEKGSEWRRLVGTEDEGRAMARSGGRRERRACCVVTVPSRHLVIQLFCRRW